jgi:hypothetical protein
MLASFIANRQNEFRAAVSKFSLPPDVKDMLHTINARRAWYSRADVVMRATGHIIRGDVRRPARVIMRFHARPSRRLNRFQELRPGRVSGQASGPARQARHSSQECGACGFVARENRTSQSEFRCVQRGHTAHADVDAAKVIAGRRSLGLDFCFATRRQVFDVLMRRFVERHDGAPRRRPGGGRTSASCPQGNEAIVHA